MALYLLDMDHLSLLRRGGANALPLEKRLSDVPEAEIVTCVVVYEEQMRAALAEIQHPNVQWHEEKGANHWWDVSPAPGAGADAVDYRPMMDFLLAARRRTAPEKITFVTVNPAVSATYAWATIEQQRVMLQPSRVELTWNNDAGTVAGTTHNVRRLRLNVPADSGHPLRRVLLDSGTVSVSGEPGQAIWLRRENGRWQRANSSPTLEKRPGRGGLFKQAFDQNFVLVYGTTGTSAENAWSYARACYDAETFLYRGNGAPNVIADWEYSARRMRDRSVILYGNSDTNRLWKTLLAGSPITVRRGQIRVGDERRAGSDLACLFVRPKPGTDTALVGAVAATGLVGMRLTDRLGYFVSGVAYPDWCVFDPSVLLSGTDGVIGAGYFGNDWKLESGESAWRDKSKHQGVPTGNTR